MTLNLNRLDSVISGNTPLQPTSVSDCPRPERDVFSIEIVGLISRSGKIVELEKGKKNVPGKDKWEIPAIIPIIKLVGVNHRLPILHMSKIMVHCYSIDETNNQFSSSYMINPSLNFNKLFRIQV